MLDESLRNFKHIDFAKDLLDWFSKNKRDLPWRRTKNPYYIWISEIMLQQTKVDTVIRYYDNFTERYPTPKALAKAEEQDVLKQWEGLGYYSRARNLHTAVKEVVEKYEGEVPKDPKKLGKLKGIGPYTKGAIMSIAFNEPEPAVDGNVMRVLARILAINDNIMEQKTRRRFERIVRTIIHKDEPGNFNEALMELGALVCIPRSPRCSKCPVKTYCQAYKENKQQELPVRLRKTKQTKKEYLTFLLFNEKGHIAIEQRPSKGLLANMWQFPMIDKKSIKGKTATEIFAKRYGLPIEIKRKLGEATHQFSHKAWTLTAYEAIVLKDELEKDMLQFVSISKLKEYPISVAHQKVQSLSDRFSN